MTTRLQVSKIGAGAIRRRSPGQAGPASWEMNPELSGANLSQIQDPGNTPLLYEAGYPTGTDPVHDGGWNVLFADGRVVLMTPEGPKGEFLDGAHLK